jgi:hypothetical protein
MLDWVPEDHVVRLVIGTVEAVVTPELIAWLVPAVRSRKGRRRYDPVMLLTLIREWASAGQAAAPGGALAEPGSWGRRVRRRLVAG